MPSNKRYLCIHGHFYQPPRENPWLEAIERQESAEPYHDWNERIAAECYLPNSAARIQSSDGAIVGIINNYARMSFNFGPTLLSWMETHYPDNYRGILQADKASVERFGGHGSAMAQVYNHVIMPLANARDKETQILWGIRDFEHRFDRKPEGMWLAEAAVDTETLELLAENGIKFTVLAPRQAKAARPRAANSAQVPDAGWQDVSDMKVDPKCAYECPLPSGKTIAIFFYDGPISQAIAFEGILNSGEAFAERLLTGFTSSSDSAQLLHVATDGETYGHHHKFGDMALAYALHYIEANKLAQLTNYGEFLAMHPPEWEVRIFENSSWSCAHGIERWSDDCGCSSGMHPGWSQQWRKPLRQALDWLRDTINPAFEKIAGELFDDPWSARNDYINVVLSRSAGTRDQFLTDNAIKPMDAEGKVVALQLMEMQRQLMLMYTSCGWFFDELSGIETVQIMQYAARAIQLAEQSLGLALESEFRQRLGRAKSNIVDHTDGANIYDKFVRTAQVDLVRVGAHYAVTSLFQPEAHRQNIYAFTVVRKDWQLHVAAPSRLVVGQAQVISNTTLEKADIAFCVLHMGSHNLIAGVSESLDAEEFEAVAEEITATFNRSDLPGVIRLVDSTFSGGAYNLQALFKDEREKVITEILRTTLQQAEPSLRAVFDANTALIRFLTSVDSPIPDILQATGRFIVGTEIRNLLEQDTLDADRLTQLVNQALELKLTFNGQGIEVPLNRAISAQTLQLSRGKNDAATLKVLIALANLGVRLPAVSFWQAQNVIFELMKIRYHKKQGLAKKGDAKAAEWIDLYRQLSGMLKVNVDKN